MGNPNHNDFIRMAAPSTGHRRRGSIISSSPQAKKSTLPPLAKVSALPYIGYHHGSIHLGSDERALILPTLTAYGVVVTTSTCQTSRARRGRHEEDAKADEYSTNSRTDCECSHPQHSRDDFIDSRLTTKLRLPRDHLDNSKSNKTLYWEANIKRTPNASHLFAISVGRTLLSENNKQRKRRRHRRNTVLLC